MLGGCRRRHQTPRAGSRPAIGADKARRQAGRRAVSGARGKAHHDWRFRGRHQDRPPAGLPVIAVDLGYADVPAAELEADRVISHFDELTAACAELLGT
jgi:hypothetical protein